MSNELEEKLKKIKTVFDTEDIVSLQTGKDYVQKYYSVNKIPYSFFHTKSGLMCMGISRDGVFKEDDLFEAARTVENYIKDHGAKKVLELATGGGAHSYWLAKRHYGVSFYGVDLSNKRLDIALEKAKKVNNYHPSHGDYHDLKAYESNTFDIVFVVEALCYSTVKEEVLHNVHRILKPGGVFIVFDGYLNKELPELTTDESLAVQLTERGMALEKFENYADFKGKIKRANFTLHFEENVSSYVMPTMRKFERLAQKFFSHPVLAKVIVNVFPKEFTYNSLSGYLMPFLFETEVFSYWITILKK